MASRSVPNGSSTPPHDPRDALQRSQRRVFLGRMSQGIGSVALASLFQPSITSAQPPQNASQAPDSIASFPSPGLQPKIKRVIWLSMAGGPSQFESFDPKPKLGQMDGQPMPASLTQGQQLAQLQGSELVCKAPQFRFKPFGQAGTEICELFPHIGSIVDDICIIRSLTTDAINHDPAHLFMNTGSQLPGRPSMGSWITYGLGSESTDLPGFVVLTSLGPGRSAQPIAARQWNNGFLPSRYQGVQLRSRGDAVLYLQNPAHLPRELDQRDITAINQLNRQFQSHVDDPEIATRIAQYEMAFQMQASIPGLMDLGDEDPAVLEEYGCKLGDGSFAGNCLLARRLAERGVRFIQLYHRDWDHHSQLVEEFPLRAKEVDRASAVLIRDLQRRGLFEDTLVVWAGEFGRTPMAQTSKGTLGRDHHNLAMSIWLAGGGIRGGLVFGATDDLGYAAIENRVTVHDLHATMLHLLGIDHERLTYKVQGLDMKLTGVEGANVIRDILT